MKGTKRWQKSSWLGLLLCLGSLLAGCSASTKNVGSLVLPTSNRTIDVVLHKAEIRGCLDFQVLQTYNAEGTLIDSQRGYGTTLPCVMVGAAIEAGGNVGAAAIAAKAFGKAAAAASNASSVTVNATSNAVGGTSTSQGGASGGTNGGGGHSGGEGGGHPNNGFGNGGGDGVPGHSGHSDNGR